MLARVWLATPQSGPIRIRDLLIRRGGRCRSRRLRGLCWGRRLGCIWSSRRGGGRRSRRRVASRRRRRWRSRRAGRRSSRRRRCRSRRLLLVFVLAVGAAVRVGLLRPPVQYRWPILVFVGDHRSRVLLVFLRNLLSRGSPRALGDPDMVQLSGLRNREDALGYTSAKPFVHDSEIERHGNRRRLIRPGVVKLSVHHDGNGSEAGFAFRRNLHQSYGARSLVNRGLVTVLGRQTLGHSPGTGEPDCGSQGDGEQPVAI